MWIQGNNFPALGSSQEKWGNRNDLQHINVVSGDALESPSNLYLMSFLTLFLPPELPEGPEEACAKHKQTYEQICF